MPTETRPIHSNSTAEEFSALQSNYAYQGRWCPLYLEPMVGSGERLTFAIAAYGNDGRQIVSRVIRPDVLKVFYGKKARALNEMLAAAEAAVLAALTDGRENPIMPADGLEVGKFRNARGRSLEDLVEQGRMMCASLAATSVEAGQASDTDEDARQTGQWATQVQRHVVERSDDLAPYFARTAYRKGSRIPSKYGFFNDYYVANFGVIRHDNPQGSLYHLKPRLWDLENAAADLAGAIRGRDLLLARPNLQVATLSLALRNHVRDVIDMVVSEADKHSIYVFHTDRVDEASARLYEQARKLAA